MLGALFVFSQKSVKTQTMYSLTIGIITDALDLQYARNRLYDRGYVMLQTEDGVLYTPGASSVASGWIADKDH